MKHAKQGTRPGTARYRKLGYVALNVVDVARSRDFYENQVGLQWNGQGEEGEQFFPHAESDMHFSLMVYKLI